MPEPVLRLAVLSDIHGNLAALDAVLADLDRFGVDRLWLLGDLAAFGPRPAACVERVRRLQEVWGDGLSLVRGNTDRYLVTGERRGLLGPATRGDFPGLAEDWRQRDLALSWGTAQLSFADYELLRGLPDAVAELDVAGYGGVTGYHGLPGDDEGWLAPDTPLPNQAWRRAFAGRSGRLGIGGHTHEPMDRHHQGWRLLNAGSVGAPRARRGAEYVVIDFVAGDAVVEVRRIAFDAAAVAADIRRQVDPETAEWMCRKMRL